MLVGIVCVEREVQAQMHEGCQGEKHDDAPAEPIGDDRSKPPEYERIRHGAECLPGLLPINLTPDRAMGDVFNAPGPGHEDKYRYVRQEGARENGPIAAPVTRLCEQSCCRYDVCRSIDRDIPIFASVNS